MKKEDFPQRKSTRLKDFDYSTMMAYFITICTLNKSQYFTNDTLNQKIIECIFEERKRTQFLIYVYCLMPDHLHLCLCPPGNGVNISSFIGGLKSKTTRIAWDNGIQGKLWQGRFYDHVLRKKESINKVGEYILNNPVRKGIIGDWRKYKYCGIIDPWN